MSHSGSRRRAVGIAGRLPIAFLVSMTTLHTATVTSSVALAARLPPFAASSSPVTATELGATWHPGCPVVPSALRGIRLRFVGFDGRSHIGTVVVNEAVVTEVERVFRTLYLAAFPLRSLRPESDFAGSDPASMAADNSSGFNCRLAVTSGPRTWSVHAYGEAIDVNPVENPYRYEGNADPPHGRPFLNRTKLRPGMALPGGVLVRAFAGVGWYWGGRWTASPDYQHFSSTGG